MSWRDVARRVVAETLAAHKDADEKTIRRALTAAYPFGQRKYWPYKVWCDEVRLQRGRKRTKRFPGSIDKFRADHNAPLPNQMELFP